MKHIDNIRTYIKFRGDLDIKHHPFNEVDALILTQLSYIRFENIVPTIGDVNTITIKDAAHRYQKSTENNVIFYEEAEEIFAMMSTAPRYSNMTLCNYVNQIDIMEHKQFSALHINIAPKQTFIAFRGTDQTIIGWREDCNMTYMMPVPSQKSAVEYVNETIKNGLFHKYYLGGHSKGGNLAIYSGIYCDSKIQKKLAHIYSFDGPGFNKTVVNDAAYLRIKDKISSFVPVASVIGLLMEHEEAYKIVKSSEVTFMQHDAFSWMINGTAFEVADSLDEFSTKTSRIVKTWLENTDLDERKLLVDGIFDVLEQAGIIEINNFAEIDLKTAGALIKAASSIQHEQREVVVKLMKLLIEESIRRKKNKNA